MRCSNITVVTDRMKAFMLLHSVRFVMRQNSAFCFVLKVITPIKGSHSRSGSLQFGSEEFHESIAQGDYLALPLRFELNQKLNGRILLVFICRHSGLMHSLTYSRNVVYRENNNVCVTSKYCML